MKCLTWMMHMFLTELAGRHQCQESQDQPGHCRTKLCQLPESTAQWSCAISRPHSLTWPDIVEYLISCQVTILLAWHSSWHAVTLPPGMSISYNTGCWMSSFNSGLVLWIDNFPTSNHLLSHWPKVKSLQSEQATEEMAMKRQIKSFCTADIL